MPKLSRRSRFLLVLGAIVLVVLVLGGRVLNAYIDWLWYGEVGYRSVFSTVVVTKLVLLVALGALVGGLFALSLWIAYRGRPVFVPVSGPDDPVARYRTLMQQHPRVFAIGVPVAVGLIAGLSAQADWQTVQLYLNSTPFGINDPEFGNDIGFYAFQLPFYRWLLSWGFVIVALSFFGALITHYIFGGIRLAGRGGTLSVPARIQLAVLAGMFVLFKAVAYYFDRYELLYSVRNQLFTGATYTDLNAVLPAKLILTFIAAFCAVAFFAGAFLRNLQLPAIALVLLVLSSLLVGAAWPAVLEQISVKPNARDKEAVSIERNITATRQAYGITEDKVTFQPYEGKTDQLSPQEVAADTGTIPNVRLLDPSVLSQTFTQLQQRRNFYGFPAKLDVDRYNVNGRLEDYIVAVRELNTSGLAENQRNWINRHLIYTHGNGFVAAPANKVNSALRETGGEGGYPAFTVSDLSTKGAIPVEQPRIYYGELNDGYAIVGAQRGEKAREYDTDTSQFTYDGSGGVPIGSWWNRLAFAAHESERNILFSSAISDDSKILYNRDPRDRVRDIAPWLTADGDPYPAVVKGRIKWIVDGYTTLEQYPYSQQAVLGDVTNDTLPGVARQPDRRISYIRNSVKATVDAYDGTVSLFAIDEQDPVLRAWRSVFPGVVKPAGEIDDALREHFRYPEDLFKIQRKMLTSYHVSQPANFFENVSFWDVPSDPTVEGAAHAAIAPQPPYYVVATDPVTKLATFQLTSALVFKRRDFMSAYVTVNSDPAHYGKITVLQLPNETQTKGPQQVQTQFVSSSQVSSELNLLRQQQTNIKYGNLLTLPIGGGLLYVEPVYIERNNQESSFPQLAKVLVNFGGRVGYAPTLAEALDQVFGKGAGQTSTGPDANQPPPSTSPSPTSGATQPPVTSNTSPPPSNLSPDLARAAGDINSALERLRKAQQDGDFQSIGQAQKDLADAAKRFQDARNAPAPTTQAPPPTPGGN
jgi:uncharacterized membrane protein (UPF0182 family)